MPTPTVIKIENVSKKFTRSIKRSMAYGSFDLIKKVIGIPVNRSLLRPSEFWALEDVNLEIHKGEKVGFLGENGSGKSTLLRMINGIFPPDTGSIKVDGSIGALIAVGAGFHPHMTGRENIFLNGTILGMKRKEIESKLDEIIHFAELGEFMDAPVSTYSSGMRVRLGFSIAVHTKPDIMLVDEILAVGDLAFQLKCLRKLADFRDEGGTFIIVSHNMQVIRNSCDRVIWLESGKVIDSGDVDLICSKYEASQISKSFADEQSSQQFSKDNKISLDPLVKITSVELLDKRDKVIEQLAVGEPLSVKITYDAQRKVLEPIFAVGVHNGDGQLIIESYSDKEGLNLQEIEGQGELFMRLPQFAYKPGIYSFTVMLSEQTQLRKLEWHEKSYKLSVVNDTKPINQGLAYPYPTWSHHDHLKA